jgi:uncharacterized damage-inducible protein DinB
MTTLQTLDIAPYWQSVQEDIVRIVDLIPDDSLNFSPKPELWNSKGILIHVADARDRWMTRDVKDGEEYPGIWTTVKTKDDIRRELARTFARVQRFLGNQAQLDATYTSDFDGRKYNGHWIAFHLLEHDIHHRAELMQRLAHLDIDHGLDL